jgi:hypothetical protein
MKRNALVPEKQIKRKSDNMKKAEQLTEYDFSNGKRGKYARQYAAGTNLIALEPDVAKVFKDATSVNETLRTIAKIVLQKKKQTSLNK